MKAFSISHTALTTGGHTIQLDTTNNISAAIHGVGTILVHPWGRGLYNLLADHASGAAALDQLEFWLEGGDAPTQVVLEFDHRGDWGMSPTIREGLTPEERAAIKAVLRAIYAQARGED